MSNLRVITGGEQLAFSYDALETSVAIEVRASAERIQLRLRRTAEDIVEIGRDLLGVKAKLPHGAWLPWLQTEFGMSESAAGKMMAVAKVYGGKSVMITDLSPTALYELAAPKTPIEIREEVEKMIAAGEVIPAAKIAEMKREFAAAEKAAQDAIAALTARNSELANSLSSEAEDEAPHLALDEARENGSREAEARLTPRITELSEANVNLRKDAEQLRADLERLKAEREADKPKGAPASNVVALPVAAAASTEDDDEIPDESSAIDAFSGALGSMFGLEFSPEAFWKNQGRTGSHAKRIHRALLSVNATIGLLIMEHSK